MYRYILYLACSFVTIASCYSQNKQLLYNFTELPQALNQNPGASISFNKHIGVPFLSQFHLNTGFTGFSAYDIFKDDGTNINQKIKRVINDLDNKDFISINQQLEILNFGWRKNESTYLSFGFYQELDVINYFPKDLAVLAWEGNADHINRSFRLSDLKIKGELLSVYHFGINKVVNKKITLGFRAKLYSSVFNFQSINNRGTFTTRNSTTDNNIYEHLLNSDIKIQTSGLASFLSDENSDIKRDVKDFRKRLLFGNLGLGVDIGATYRIDDQLDITGSILDVGGIYHYKDVENYTIKGNYNIEGLELVFPEILNGESTNPYWDNLIDDIEEQVTIDTTKTKYFSWRPMKINSGINYKFGKNQGKECDCKGDTEGYKNGLGAHFYSVFRPRRPQFALTGYYYRRFGNALKLKATYTIDEYSFKNLGLGTSLHFGNFNMYMMVDNLLEFKNISKAQSVSLQLGMNLIFD